MRCSVTTVLGMLLVLAGLDGLVSEASAKEGRTILVLDGSGSMWGEVEGKAKITIAQEVIGTLLDRIPEEQKLGLLVYGHREKGNCEDIEAMVPAEDHSADAIRSAIATIKPRGKTPISAAIRAAADDLKYQEEKATVILVSDGLETCNADPCAVATALEDAGADFTAHVIGFDIRKPEDIRQLDCIAINTGGQFFTAETAPELVAALETVAEVAPTEPRQFDVSFSIVDADGQPLEEDAQWRVVSLADGTEIGTWSDSRGGSLELVPGRYGVSAQVSDTEGAVEFDVGSEGSEPVRIVLAQAAQPAVQPSEGFDDHFDGDGLSDVWSIEREDPNAYIVENSALLIVGSKVEENFAETNAFILDAALPEGDWDIVIDAVYEANTDAGRLVWGLYTDPDNALTAKLWNDGGGECAGIDLEQRSGGSLNEQVALMEGLTQSCNYNSNNYSDWLGQFSGAPLTLTFSKRGRAYHASVAQGANVTETLPLTSLRSPGKPFIAVTKWEDVSGEVLVAIDRVQILPK